MTSPPTTAMGENHDLPAVLAPVATILSCSRGQKVHRRQESLERARARAELAARSARGPQLLLWSAATGEQATICGPDGRVIWRQRFSDLPALRVETELDAIAAAARQGIWIAGRARLEWGAETARLRLIMDRRRRSLDQSLHRHAYVAGLALEVIADPAANPARYACADTTPVDWHPNLGLSDLLLVRRIPT
ncbi:hypothetical protein ACWDYH_31240 [Nocardia goodfellowii]